MTKEISLKTRAQWLLPVSLVAASLLGCSKSADLPYQKSESFAAMGDPAEKALQIFAKECRHIANGAEDLEYIKAESGPALPKTPDYGWNKGVAVELKVKGDPTTGDAMRMASGHVCSFDMGGGFKPGIYTSKSSCAVLCSSPEGEKFIPVSDMSVLESEQEADEAEKKRLADGAEAFAALEKKAKGGDYQAQRNTAYSLATGAQGAPYNPVRACAWYALILFSGNPKVNDSDKGNVDLYCGRLTTEQRRAAQEVVAVLATQVK